MSSANKRKYCKLVIDIINAFVSNSKFDDVIHNLNINVCYDAK